MRGALVALVVTVTGTVGGCVPAPSSPTVTLTASPSATSPSPSPSPSVTPSPRSSTVKQARSLVEPAVARVTITEWQTDVEDPQTGDVEDRCTLFVGTAFSVYPHLLVTAAHVVEDSDRVRVTLGTVATEGEVVGYNRKKDVALIRIEQDTPDLLHFAQRPAKAGDEVATLGYADTLGLSFLSGNVNRVNTKHDVEDNFMTGLTEVDFPAKGGNSGGPVFNASGDSVGILVAGPDAAAGGRLVVPASTVAPMAAKWRAEPDTGDLSQTTCPLLPNESVPAGTEVTEEYPASVHSAALTLLTYVIGVNTADYKTAFAQLADGGDFDKFVDGVESSRISNVDLHVVPSTKSPMIDVDFTSSQDAGEGPKGRQDEECTDWHLRYTFASQDGIQLIDKVRAQPGEPTNEACFQGDAD